MEQSAREVKADERSACIQGMQEGGRLIAAHRPANGGIRTGEQQLYNAGPGGADESPAPQRSARALQKLKQLSLSRSETPRGVDKGGETLHSLQQQLRATMGRAEDLQQRLSAAEIHTLTAAESCQQLHRAWTDPDGQCSSAQHKREQSQQHMSAAEAPVLTLTDAPQQPQSDAKEHCNSAQRERQDPQQNLGKDEAHALTPGSGSQQPTRAQIDSKYQSDSAQRCAANGASQAALDCSRSQASDASAVNRTTADAQDAHWQGESESHAEHNSIDRECTQQGAALEVVAKGSRDSLRPMQPDSMRCFWRRFCPGTEVSFSSSPLSRYLILLALKIYGISHVTDYE